MVSNFIRHLVGTFFWLGLVAVSAAMTCWAVLEHYLNAQFAMELVGFENRQVWRDALIGPFLNALAPGLTLPQAVAVTIAVTSAVVFFIACDLVARIVRLLQYRRGARHQGLEVEAREAAVRAIGYGVLLAAVAVILMPAVRFDFELFRLRALAGAKGMEFPNEVAELPNWPSIADDSDLSYSIWLAHAGAWGYLAFTVLGCVALHYSMGKVAENFTTLMAPIDDAWVGVLQSRDDASYTHPRGAGVRDVPFAPPDVPTAADDSPVAPGSPPDEPRDERGTPQHRPNANGAVDGAEGDGPGLLFSPPAAPKRDEAATPAGDGTERPADDAVGIGRGEPSSEMTASVGADETAGIDARRRPPARSAALTNPAVPVMGGQRGESTTLEGALQAPDRFVVDTTTGRIWSRAFWTALHGESSSNGNGPKENTQ